MISTKKFTSRSAEAQPKKFRIIKAAKNLLADECFKARHRADIKAFTRNRCLPFIFVLFLVLLKSVKSLQLVLNEFFVNLSRVGGMAFTTVTASAFTQARQKLSHTAFIELNRQAIVETYYTPGTYKTWLGHRLLAIDGSKIRLPNTPEIRKEFGTIAYANQNEEVKGEHSWALASVCYDVLNDIAIDAILAKAHAYEVDLAIDHLKYITPGDLLMCDRNYPEYRFVATLSVLKQKKGNEFVIRCSESSFKQARLLFANDGVDSVVVTLKPCHAKKKQIAELGLPMEITVRFVRVVLDTGDAEVLVTSLLDETKYPTSIFKGLYNLRWGVETFYGRIKGRLNLENFSGRTVEAVKQDFYATIFISSIESVLTEDAEIELQVKSVTNLYPQQVNKAVSFNAIKNHVIELFYTESNSEVIYEKLTQLFLTNPVCFRKQRQVERKKPRARTVLNFYKRIRKACY